MSPTTRAGGLSAADGVYTTEQATRGERTARTSCFPCHTPAEWSDPGLIDMSSGGDLGEMYQFIRSQMPPNNPGGLRSDQYANVFAYMLKLRGASPGETELPGDPDELRRVFAPPGAAGPGSDPGTSELSDSRSADGR
jgi:mono/diheme cytochrome c family protein